MTGADTHEFAVAAIGADRPGIVAAVSRALVGAQMGIEDSSMTILGGQFAMLLLVRANATQDEVEHVLQPAANEFELTLSVQQSLDSAVAPDRHGQQWVVAAYGPDRPGLVAALAEVLAENGANVTDFGSRVTDGGTFTMWFNVTLPGAIDIDDLRGSLAQAGGDVQLDVTMNPIDNDAL